MILLSAQNISKTYMERKVLDNVSFFLNEGDKVGIVGINGTGKSTLLRILAGAEEPDSGEIARARPAPEPEPVRRRTARRREVYRRMF